MEVINALGEKHLTQLHNLYQQEWWTKGRTLEETRACVAGSQVCIGLVKANDELVGFARILTDYIFKALIFDVLVRADERGRGLGDELLSQIKKHDKLKAACLRCLIFI